MSKSIEANIENALLADYANLLIPRIIQKRSILSNRASRRASFPKIASIIPMSACSNEEIVIKTEK